MGVREDADGPDGRRVDRGQSAIEFAIGLPIVVISLLAIAQVAVIVRDQLALESAARNAARAASVTTDSGSAIDSGRAETGVDDIRITLTEGDGTVTATASRTVRSVPIVGIVVAGKTQDAEVTMLIEPP